MATQLLQQGGSGSQPSGPPLLRNNTRQRIQKVGQIAPSLSGQGTLLLPQVGYLNRIFLVLDGTITDSSTETPTVAAFWPWNFFKRISVVTNLGTATLFDTSGYGAFVKAILSSKDVINNTQITGITNDPFYNVSNVFTAATAKFESLVLPIEIAQNDHANFALGLINLQAPEIRVNVNLTFGSTTDLFTNAAGTITLGGNVNVYYEYFEVPAPSRGVMVPPLVLHRTIEDRLGYASTGDVLYTVPRQGKLLRLIHTVSANAAILTAAGSSAGNSAQAFNGVNSHRLVFNKTDTPYNMEYMVTRMLLRYRYGHNEIPPGSFVLDFFAAAPNPNTGDLRDVVDTEAISTVESILNIDSGVTLGSGTNFIDTVREFLQPLRASA